MIQTFLEELVDQVELSFEEAIWKDYGAEIIHDSKEKYIMQVPKSMSDYESENIRFVANRQVEFHYY